MDTTTTYRIDAIAPQTLDAARAGSPDAGGTPPERRTADGGEPLRCCLRDASPGEELILFGYRPPLPEGPYREYGPVFAHATPCGGAVDGRYPEGWLGRPQVYRAYDAEGRIHPATRVHDGSAPDAVLDEMLADPSVIGIHSRNVAYGCFMFTVTRTA
ncbi:DUF1203 domain-containing protein [Cryptosporangium aurantiacum]|uniref:DUF1203 domain-containing protein n=1 Tax=Cryptosporangium aurantiacum TaxID=134849 RepID=A0A1M7RPM8_9ACTN|nr:DUF1203 domain-containing protein [Cryptosporangium aurantiacum]SHN48052.1 Protein of unknown function [Cryptosporangium aurantiacum]